VKKVLFVFAILINGLVANAQTLGLKLGTEVYLPTYDRSELLTGPTAGIYFHQTIIGRLGVSIAADYLYTEYHEYSDKVICGFAGPCSKGYKFFRQTHSLHIPAIVSFNFFRNQSRSWFVGVFAGTDINTILRSETDGITLRDYPYGNKSYSYENGLLVKNSNSYLDKSLIAGLEIKHQFKSKISSSLGIAIAKTNFNGYPTPHKIDFASLYLKTGLNLKKKQS
jgi:hypothetical protein